MGLLIKSKKYRWKDAIVPFTDDPGLNATQATAARQAREHWEEMTPFRFIRYRSSSHDDYVTFHDGGACQSKVGRRGGQQFISLTPGCSLGAAIHEIGHAIGMYHEHTHPDRSQFIDYIQSNVDTDQFGSDVTDNFKRKKPSDVITPTRYDFLSIMHYGDTAFAKAGVKTLRVKPGYGYDDDDIGQRNVGLTYWDRSAAHVAAGEQPLADLIQYALHPILT